MRIISGIHRGRKISTPKGNDIRPTSDRARAAIFNLLDHQPDIAASNFQLNGARVADICCGTGALGLEALSRGAAHATFVDSSATSLHCARENTTHIGEMDRAYFMKRSAVRLSTATEPYQLIFLDPPYPANLWTAALRSLAEHQWVSNGTIIVMESDSTKDTPTLPDNYHMWDERSYGAARLTLLHYAQTNAQGE